MITPDDVLAVLRQSARRVAPGGGTVTLSFLGGDVGATSKVYSVSCTPSRRRSTRAIGLHRERFASEVVAGATPVVASAFEQPRPRQSPIAAGITKVALSRPDGDVVLVVLSDLLECSGGPGRRGLDLECGPLPDTATFTAWLDRQGLLAEGSLTGVVVVHVGFADVNHVDKDRCPADVSRRTAVNALFTAALSRAGAGAISITTGAPVIDSAGSGAGRGAK